MDTQAIEKYQNKLDAKTTVGELLAVNAQSQRLKLVDTPEADEVYIREWALNTVDDLNTFIQEGKLRKRGAGRNVFYVWKQEE